MCVYLRAEFEVSSLILTSFRQRVQLYPTPPPPPPAPATQNKQTPKKPTQVKGYSATSMFLSQTYVC